MFILYELGPDNHSTYQECWGTEATSPGRVIDQSFMLIGLVRAVKGLDHDNWWIRGPLGETIATSRAEYFALPEVQQHVEATEAQTWVVR